MVPVGEHQHAFIVIVVALSVLLQLTAAVCALRLIPVTGRRTAWLLVAAAIALMTFRRVGSLLTMLSPESHADPSLVFEGVGLAISVLMLAGICRIRPVFEELASSREDLRTMNEKLSTLSEDQVVLIARLQDALVKVRTLKGLLPICASCKKVRDDKGYWHQVEVYIRDRSEAEFSHGICPECEQKYYEQYPYLKEQE